MHFVFSETATRKLLKSVILKSRELGRDSPFSCVSNENLSQNFVCQVIHVIESNPNLAANNCKFPLKSYSSSLINLFHPVQFIYQRYFKFLLNVVVSTFIKESLLFSSN